MKVLRRLQGITYWVIQEPREIRHFVNTNVRKEWEVDARAEGRDPSDDAWLQNLSKREWRLEIVPVRRIVLNPAIMNYDDPQKGYNFQSSLSRRTKELRTAIERYGVVIWPLVVRKEDMMLVDGYCRLTTLREMSISRVYVYTAIV